MTVKITQEVSATRPQITPIKSSVVAHATVKDLSSFGLRNNAGLWPSYNCLDVLVPTTLCPDPLADSTKTFSVAEWQGAFEFAVYGAVQCNPVGLDVADQQSEVRRVFSLAEGKGVERALLETRFADTGPGSDEKVQWEPPVDLTPGSDISLAVALALLEGYAAANYAGVPTIHMPRAAASLLNERIVWQGDLAYTRLGSKVAIGGGYDNEDGDFSNEWDLYATGEVYIERSEQVDVHSYVLPGDGSGVGSGENGLSDNTSIALAERMYRVAVDCFAAKATGKVW